MKLYWISLFKAVVCQFWLICSVQHLHKKLEDLLINCKLLEKTAISRNGNGQKYWAIQYFCSFSFREMVGSFLINCLFKKSSEYFLFLQNGLTITLAVVAALQTAVIAYGLQKFYQTWSRMWAVTKSIFNLLKNKLKKSEKAEERKEKNIQLKLRKSSLKRLGQIL